MTLSNNNYKQVQQQDDLFDAAVIVARPVEEVVDSADAPTGPVAASCWNETRCAGCVGAMAGCFTSGFCMSIICATGCMYFAKTHEGMGGDIARACGSVGVQANVMVRDLDDEHKLLEKSKQLGIATMNRAKQLNDEYQITQKTKNCIVSTVKAGVAFTQEHKLVERTAQGVIKVLSVLATEVTTATGSNAAASHVAEAFSDPEIYASETETPSGDSPVISMNTDL